MERRGLPAVLAAVLTMACLVPVFGKLYLYYLGWNLGVTVPWRNSIGLAMIQRGENALSAGHGFLTHRTFRNPRILTCAANAPPSGFLAVSAATRLS